MKKMFMTLGLVIFTFLINIDLCLAKKDTLAGNTPPTFLDPLVYNTTGKYRDNESNYKGVPYEIECHYTKIYEADSNVNVTESTNGEYVLKRKLEIQTFLSATTGATDGSLTYNIVNYNEGTKIEDLRNAGGKSINHLLDKNGKGIGRDDNYNYYYMCPKSLQHKKNSKTSSVAFSLVREGADDWKKHKDYNKDTFVYTLDKVSVVDKGSEEKTYIKLLGHNEENDYCKFEGIDSDGNKIDKWLKIRTYWDGNASYDGQDKTIRISVQSNINSDSSEWYYSEIGAKKGSVEVGDIFKHENQRNEILKGQCDNQQLAFILYNGNGGLHFVQFVSLNELGNNGFPSSNNIKLNAGKWDEVYAFKNEKIDEIRKNYKPNSSGGGSGSGEIYEEKFDCDSLGSLLDWLNGIFLLIKIGVPLLIIILGIVDFITAMGSDSEDNMKKTWSKFVKRLIIGAVIILIPYVIQLLLNIVGYGDSTCGIN